MNKIFIVDDDQDILFVLEIWLTQKGLDVTTFENALSIITDITDNKPDLVLLDVNLKGADGRMVCKEIKTTCAHKTIVILFSANVIALENYQDNCADGIIHKPFDLDDIELKIKGHLGIAC